MAKYIINRNTQPTGENEVHEEAVCNNLPEPENRVLVGYFDSCRSAITAAKAKWPRNTIDGCAHCTGCHTR